MLDHYYKILNIPAGSNEETIKKAFRQLALRMHPDVNDSPDATEKFRALCEAYEVLLSQKQEQPEQKTVNSNDEKYVYNWDEIIREAKKRAAERVRIRYEKLKAEQELFEKSGIRDFLIVIKYLWSIIAPVLSAWLIIWPVYTAINEGFELIFVMMLFWIAGFSLASHIYKKRKNWFNHGRLNLNLQTVKNYFDFSKYNDVTTDCAYCKGHKGRGKPFKFSMLKVREIKTRNDGPLQHYVNYNRKYKELLIPRSKKAFYVHFTLSFLKPISFITGLFLIPFPGFLWRFYSAFFLTLALEGLVLLVFRTSSKVSFLLTPFLVLKIIIWLLVSAGQTFVYPGFILGHNDILILLIGLMLVFLDMFMDLLLRIFPFYSWFYKPIPTQMPGIEYLYKKGFQPYLDIPIWSSLYPFFRWLF